MYSIRTEARVTKWIASRRRGKKKAQKGLYDEHWEHDFSKVNFGRSVRK